MIRDYRSVMPPACVRVLRTKLTRRKSGALYYGVSRFIFFMKIKNYLD